MKKRIGFSYFFLCDTTRTLREQSLTRTPQHKH